MKKISVLCLASILSFSQRDCDRLTRYRLSHIYSEIEDSEFRGDLYEARHKGMIMFVDGPPGGGRSAVAMALKEYLRKHPQTSVDIMQDWDTSETGFKEAVEKAEEYTQTPQTIAIIDAQLYTGEDLVNYRKEKDVQEWIYNYIHDKRQGDDRIPDVYYMLVYASKPQCQKNIEATQKAIHDTWMRSSKKRRQLGQLDKESKTLGNFFKESLDTNSERKREEKRRDKRPFRKDFHKDRRIKKQTVEGDKITTRYKYHQVIKVGFKEEKFVRAAVWAALEEYLKHNVIARSMR